MADITKIKVIENGVETVKEIGVSTPIKNELNKRANKEETIRNINVSTAGNTGYGVYYNAFKELAKVYEPDKHYLVNCKYLCWLIPTFNNNYILTALNLTDHTTKVFNKTGYGVNPETCIEEDFNSPIETRLQPQLTAGEGITIENNVISASSEFVTLKQIEGSVTVKYLDENGTEYNELGSFSVDRVRLKFVNTSIIDIDKPIRINLISTSEDTDLDGRRAVLLHWTNEGYIRSTILDEYGYDIGIDPVSEFLLINNDMEEDCYIEFEVSLLLYDTSDISRLSFEIVGHRQNQFTNPSSFFEL